MSNSFLKQLAIKFENVEFFNTKCSKESIENMLELYSKKREGFRAAKYYPQLFNLSNAFNKFSIEEKGVKYIDTFTINIEFLENKESDHTILKLTFQVNSFFLNLLYLLLFVISFIFIGNLFFIFLYNGTNNLKLLGISFIVIYIIVRVISHQVLDLKSKEFLKILNLITLKDQEIWSDRNITNYI